MRERRRLRLGSGSRARSRGQSEVVGFAVVFGVVVLAIALVSATGLAGLQDTQRAERVNDAVRASETLAANVDDLVDGRAPDRGTVVSLGGSRLSFDEPVTVTVNGTRVGSPADSFSYDVSARPIRHDVGDASLVYAAGAVVREQPHGSLLVREPSFVISEREVVLPVVQTRPDGVASVAGESEVDVRTGLAKRELLVAEPEPYDVEITVTSPRSAAWGAYFEGLDVPGSTVTYGPDTATLSVRTQRVYVTVVRVDVSFE